MNEVNKIYFNIQEVANIIGITSATIRNWEKREVFIAKRNSSNYRIYSFDDIEILKKIKHYSSVEGLNIATIKRIIENKETVNANFVNELVAELPQEKKQTKKTFGNRWREYRLNKKLTLKDVSDKTAISISHISRIEHGDSHISLNILNKLSSFYGQSVLYFYGDSDDKKIPKTKISVQEREIIDVKLPGVKIEMLSDGLKKMMSPAIFYLEPYTSAATTHAHNGEEFVLVLEGTLKITLDKKEEHQLLEGESIYFSSSSQHFWENNSPNKTKLIWVHSRIGLNE